MIFPGTFAQQTTVRISRLWRLTEFRHELRVTDYAGAALLYAAGKITLILSFSKLGCDGGIR
jgi:hypothetical protein